MNELRPNTSKKIFLILLQVFSLVIASSPITNATSAKQNSTNKTPLSRNIQSEKLSTDSLPKSLQIANVSVNRVDDVRVLLSWQDGGAKASLGFNVYRRTSREFTKLNSSLIAGASLNFEPLQNEPTGGYFAWWDETQNSTRGFGRSNYWIEYVGLDGQSSWHGPYNIDGNFNDVKLLNSRLLKDLVNKDSETQNDVLPEIVSTESLNQKTDSSPKQESTSSQATQWQLAAGVAAKVSVDRNGLAKISRSSLESAGINFSNPNTIKVFDSGVEIAVTVTPGGDIEFYGQNIDTPTTNKRIYWVANVNDSVNGKRIQQINAGPFDNTIQPSFFTSVAERKDRFIRSQNILNGDTENFFGSLIFGLNPTNQTVFIRGLNQSAGEQATLTVALQGLSLIGHNVLVKLNGTDVGGITFSDRENSVKQFQVSHSLLREGKNFVTLTNTTSGSDTNLCDFIRISHSRQYKAFNNRLRFSTANNQAVRVNGFTSSQIKVLDITDPLNVKEMVVTPQSNGDGTFSFTLPQGTARNFLAESSNASQYQPATKANETSTLNAATNAANFVIITHKDFIQSIEPLRALRQSQGLTPKVVNIEDVFDEFGFGQHNPNAIKDFLNHARQNWQTQPQYVLLVGDAHYDPRDYIASGGQVTDLVPTKLVDSLFTETSSDDWFVDFTNDGLAEMALGRLAVKNVAEANIVIGKILNYENLAQGSTIQNGGLMVSDGPDGYDFEGFTSQVRLTLPAQMNITTINRTQGDTATVRALIINAFNTGPGVVNFLGHGTVTSWTSASLLTANDAIALTNGTRLPMLVALTCLNGSFAEVGVNSLSESAQKAPNGGAIAVWGSSGLTFPFGQVSISQSFYTQVFGANPPRVGDAIKQAKSATSDMDIRRLTIFLGDPTMRLR